MNEGRLMLALRTKGWLLPEEGATLSRRARDCEGPFLEIGSYAGKSTVWLGDAAEEAGTVLYAVDWHRGSPEMARGQGAWDPEFDQPDGSVDTLPAFRATMRAAGLEDSVIPVVGRSEVVAAHWATPVGFVFIDGAHDEQAIIDMGMWERHVTGMMAFHDSQVPSVQAAIWAAEERFGWQVSEQIGTLTVMTRVR